MPKRRNRAFHDSVVITIVVHDITRFCGLDEIRVSADCAAGKTPTVSSESTPF
jgi:hypothetical protein